MKINPINTVKYILNKPQIRNFKGSVEQKPDVFEKTNDSSAKLQETFVGTAFILDKENPKKKVEVNIIKKNVSENKIVYRFESKDGEHEYGHVELFIYKNNIKPNPTMVEFAPLLFKNYPEQGVTGSRLIVEYLENTDDQHFGGIGKLADKLEVKTCLDYGINPHSIISEADYGAHIAHYLRGKRFLPLEPNSEAYNYFFSHYGSTDVNEIIHDLLKEKKNGEKINIENWVATPMKLSDPLVQKYVDELKSESEDLSEENS